MPEEKSTLTTAQKYPTLKPFKKEDERTIRLAKKAGAVSSWRKGLAKKLDWLKRKYPDVASDIEKSREGIMSIIALHLDAGLIKEALAGEYAELLILNDKAVIETSKYKEKFRIKKEAAQYLLESLKLVHGLNSHNQQINIIQQQAVQIPGNVDKIWEQIKKKRLEQKEVVQHE